MNAGQRAGERLHCEVALVARFASLLLRETNRDLGMNWNKWIRQVHRWLAVSFTLATIAVLVVTVIRLFRAIAHLRRTL